VEKRLCRELERRIGYRFRDRELLKMAVTHPSFRFENDGVEEDNQRLEFLGDAVLDLLLAEALYAAHPGEGEGVLTAMRSKLASGRSLAKHARRIGLGDFLLMGKGEEGSGGRTRVSSLADALEAVIGAAYLDRGARAARKVVNHVLDVNWQELAGDRWSDNPKGRLQEFAQGKWKRGPVYRTVREDGPAHARRFSVTVALPDGAQADGHAGSKQQAEIRAAEAMLRALHGD
jgi:ribonuclease-3